MGNFSWGVVAVCNCKFKCEPTCLGADGHRDVPLLLDVGLEVGQVVLHGAEKGTLGDTA